MNITQYVIPNTTYQCDLIATIADGNIPVDGTAVNVDGVAVSNNQVICTPQNTLASERCLWQTGADHTQPWTQVLGTQFDQITGQTLYVRALSGATNANITYLMPDTATASLQTIAGMSSFLSNEITGFDFTTLDQQWQFLDNTGTPIDISARVISDSVMQYSKSGNLQVSVDFSFSVDAAISGVESFSFIAVDDSNIPLTPTTLGTGNIYTGRFIASTIDTDSPDRTNRLFGNVTASTTASGLKFTFVFDSPASFRNLNKGVIAQFDRDVSSVL